MPKRTSQQQKAIEVYCRDLAQALSDAGLDMKTTLMHKQVPVRWHQDSVKEFLFRPIMQALFPDYDSTTDLETGEVDEVYAHLDRWTSEQFGLHVEFPSQERLAHGRSTDRNSH